MATRHFVSFGAGSRSYRSALRRLKTEVRELDSEARIWFYDDPKACESIDGLSIGLSAFAERYPRGFGLWIWKPWIIWKVMSEAAYGDYVIYLDAGCTVHTSGASRNRYQFYLDYLNAMGTLHFRQNFLASEWTKREVLRHFRFEPRDLRVGQIFAGIQGYLVNESSVAFVREWLSSCTLDDGRLLLDVSDRLEEDTQFIEHRHDQSILSCLVQQQGRPSIPDETFFHPNWNRDGDGFPFWATRKRSGLPAWMGHYAPSGWPAALKSRISGKPLTRWLDPDFFPRSDT